MSRVWPVCLQISNDGVKWSTILREVGRGGQRTDEDTLHIVHMVDFRKKDTVRCNPVLLSSHQVCGALYENGTASILDRGCF